MTKPKQQAKCAWCGSIFLQNTIQQKYCKHLDCIKERDLASALKTQQKIRDAGGIHAYRAKKMEDKDGIEKTNS